MGNTQQTIDLLVRMRSDADAALNSLGAGVKKVQTQFDDGASAAGRFDGSVDKVGKTSVATGVILGNLATRAFDGLVGAFKSTITEANRLDSGLVGLSSVARAFGADTTAAQSAAQSLASDGLMSVGEAAAGLKNLLAAGFGLNEAITLMGRFKDSAAFGRQGSLEFGQAIVGATEGIKNGNSALVDNAGVTKNLSVILQEAGFQATDLQRAQSDLNVRQAIFNGILRETNPQLGDTAKYLETAAGAQAQFGSQVRTAQQALGKELQPALTAALQAMTPLVQLVADHPQTFIRLAEAVAAVVVPMVAIRGAAALGAVDLAKFAASAVSSLGAFAGISTFAEVKIAITLIGEAALGAVPGLTAFWAALTGPVGLAALAIGGVTVALVKLVEAAETSGLKAQEAAARQDTINLAYQRGARGILTYTDAVKYLNDLENVRKATAAGTLGSTNELIDAQVRAGKLTADYAAILKAANADEAEHTKQIASRSAYYQTQRDLQARINEEIKRSGFSLKELTALLGEDEQAFTAWAKSQQISAETLKYLKDRQKDAGEAAKAHAKELKDAEEKAKKLEEQAKKTGDALEKLGIVTKDQAARHFAELVDQVNAATDAGVPLDIIVSKLGGDFLALKEAVRKSGGDVAIVGAYFEDLAEGAGMTLPPARELVSVLGRLPEIKSSEEMRRIANEVRDAGEATEKTTAAFKAFGLAAPAELQAAADAARTNYETLRDSGQATTAQLRIAWQEMIDAQKAASGQLPSVWQTEVVPGIQRALGLLQTSISGTFASMLLGAKSFGEGFSDIWKSIKAAALNVFNEIASSFINGALKQMLGALTGNRGAFAGGFGGLLSSALGGGSGSSGGGGGLNLGGLFGGGERFVGPMPDGSAPGSIGIGGMSNAARFGGGALMIGGGVLQFMQGGTGNRIMGGAQTGAGIGTMIAPGIGTAIGAGAGALAGWVSTLFGVSGKEKDGRAAGGNIEDAIIGALDATEKAEAGADRWRQVLVGVRDRYKDAGHSAAEAEDVTKRLWEATAKGPAAVDAVRREIQAVTEQAGEAYRRVEADRTAALQRVEEMRQAQAAQQAVLQAQFDDLTKRRNDLWGQISQEAPEEVMGVIETAQRAQLQNLDDQAAALKVSMATQAEEAARAYQEAMDAIEPNPFHVPVVWDFPPLPGGARPTEQPELPGAANGVFATAPTFRVFAENEPELGGPVSFMTKALSGALENVGGLMAGNDAGGGGDTYFLIAPGTATPVAQITAAEAKRLEAAMASGMIRVPERAIVKRGL